MIPIVGLAGHTQSAHKQHMKMIRILLSYIPETPCQVSLRLGNTPKSTIAAKLLRMRLLLRATPNWDSQSLQAKPRVSNTTLFRQRILT